MDVYLDNAATSWPKPEAVYQAVDHFMREIGATPGRGGHWREEEALRIADETRAALAQLFNAPDPHGVAFTLNATQAINMALKGVLRPGDHALTSSLSSGGSSADCYAQLAALLDKDHGPPGASVTERLPPAWQKRAKWCMMGATKRPIPLHGKETAVRLSRRAWQAIALSLFLIAVAWGACGLLLYATPNEPSDALLDPDSVAFQVTRGCCLGPALVLAFLAYLAFSVSRRRDPALSWPALFAALGVALGLVIALVGLAIVVRPAADDTTTTRIAFTALCILPGLSLVGLAAGFWLLFGRPR